MIEFSHPSVLFFLPLALLPVILHLFWKRRKNVVHFSTLLFFEERKRYFAFRRTILEYLLLFCRVLLLGCVITAFARPCFKRFSFRNGGGVSTVILLDDTMSMQRTLPGGSTAFRQACQLAEALLQSPACGEYAGLLFFSGRPGAALTRDRNELLKVLRKAEITGSGGRTAAVFEQAAEHLKHSPGVNREIIVLSDFQRSAAPAGELPSLPGKTFAVKLGSAVPDLAVLSAALPEQIVAGREILLACRVANRGSAERETRLSLRLGGKEIASRMIRIPPHHVQQETFSMTASSPGRVNGEIRLTDDSIPMDDALPFTFSAEAPAELLLLSSSEEPEDPWYYWQFALDPRPEEIPLYGFRTIRRTDLGTALPRDCRAVFLSGNARLSPDQADRLIRWVEQGGLLFCFPGASGRSSASSLLAARSGGRIPDLFASSDFRKDPGKGLAFEGKLASLNSILQLDLIRWRKRLRLTPPPKDSMVLARAGGDPALVRIPAGSGNIVYASFGLRRSFSNWPELKSFPVAAVRLVSSLLPGKTETLSAFCGVPIPVSASCVRFPSGHTQRLPDRISPPLWTPGILTFSDGRTEAAAVVYPERETEEELLTDRGIRELFSSPVLPADPAKDLISQILAVRRGTELTGILLLTALLLSGFEFLLGARPPVFRMFPEKEEKDA